jgi:hypothetical protein
MKKGILNIAITAALGCILLSSTVYGQSTDQQGQGQQMQVTPKFTIGITGGVTIPMGNLAKTDYYNSASGFSGTGGNFGITGTWHLGKHWGITELFTYQQFSFAGGNNMALGMQAFPGGFDVDSVNFSVRGNTHTFNFLIGPSYTVQAGKKFDIDFRLLVGFVNANLAGNNITLWDGGNTYPAFYQAVSWSNTFGSQIGAALRYNITNHIGIAVNADFFYSKPDFEVNNVNRNNAAGREIYSYNQPVEGVNANLTLSYSIFK